MFWLILHYIRLFVYFFSIPWTQEFFFVFFAFTFDPSCDKYTKINESLTIFLVIEAHFIEIENLLTMICKIWIIFFTKRKSVNLLTFEAHDTKISSHHIFRHSIQRDTICMNSLLSIQLNVIVDVVVHNRFISIQ